MGCVGFIAACSIFPLANLGCQRGFCGWAAPDPAVMVAMAVGALRLVYHSVLPQSTPSPHAAKTGVTGLGGTE